MSPSTASSPTSTPTCGPTRSSPVPAGATRHTALAAAAARLVTPRPPGAPVPRLQARQLAVVDVLALEAEGQPRVPEYPLVAVEVGRRSGKTLSILSLALGRCAAWPGYRACYTAQSGLKSRDRFYDLYKSMLDAGEHLPGWKARESRGEERIELANGSVLRFGPPKGDTYRSDATDLAILDEAQEHDPELGAELLAAILPTQDTRPLAQLIVAGTATVTRDRLLWTALERARRGEEGWGIHEYAAAADVDPLDPATWWAHHPGLADGLTTERRLRINAAELGPTLFGAEYLGIWPDPAGQGALPGAAWAAAGGAHAERPAQFALGVDVGEHGERAALVAAWRPAAGEPARVELLAAAAGTGWLLELVPRLAGAGIPVGYDASGRGALDVAEQLAGVRPRLRLTPLDLTGMLTACSALYRGLVDGDVRHARQPQLDAAVDAAQRRQVGDAGWVWGRRRSEGDITPLVAATVALRVWETTKPAPRPRIRAA